MRPEPLAPVPIVAPEIGVRPAVLVTGAALGAHPPLVTREIRNKRYNRYITLMRRSVTPAAACACCSCSACCACLRVTGEALPCVVQIGPRIAARGGVPDPDQLGLHAVLFQALRQTALTQRLPLQIAPGASSMRRASAG